MHDGVDAGDGRVEPVAGLHVADDMLDVGALVRSPSAAQNVDVFPGGRQLVDEDATHGAGAAGY